MQVTTFDIHLDIRVQDTDDHEYEIETVETGETSLYIIIKPDPAVYTQIRMDEGPRPEHVNVYKTALIEHEGNVTKALGALYEYLMTSHEEG
jgi:hypothetical protein